MIVPNTPTGSSASRRQLLRQATADLHTRVDERLSGPFDTSRPAYAAFLVTLAESILPLEAALEAGGVADLLPDWAARRRSAALCRDLADLATAVPPARPVVRFVGEARLFGALYVLEGSRLGGRLLLRRVLRNPDPRTRAATRYLALGENADLWRSFLLRLEASVAAAAAPDEAIAAARQAFALFLPER